MTPAPSRLAALGAALAALALASGALAMTPALLEPKDVSGAWTISGHGATCRLTLTLEAAGHGYRVELGDCAGVAKLKPLHSWYVSSDGVGLAGDDGASLFFSKHGETRYVGAGPVGAGWTMTRD